MEIERLEKKLLKWNIIVLSLDWNKFSRDRGLVTEVRENNEVFKRERDF